MGATRAVFQLSGKCPTDMDQLNSCIREAAKISIPVFKKKLEIISVPNPLDVFTFEEAFKLVPFTISYKSVGPLLKNRIFVPPSPRFNVE